MHAGWIGAPKLIFLRWPRSIDTFPRFATPARTLLQGQHTDDLLYFQQRSPALWGCGGGWQGRLGAGGVGCVLMANWLAVTHAVAVCAQQRVVCTVLLLMKQCAYKATSIIVTKPP